jgi:hypothetical protein
MKILVIPDTQVKSDVDTTHLTHIGKYIVEKQPDVVVHLGDHWDMPSLSSYDKGTKSFEGRRYKADIEAGNAGMKQLIAPLNAFNERCKKNKKAGKYPAMHFLHGNHEQRIVRATNDDPKLDGTIGLQDLDLIGWTAHPFLEVFVLSGIAFSHYFTTGVMGRPCTSATAQLSKKHMSCVAGHQQGLQIATSNRADGASLTSIICGSCYTHEENYLGPQGNKHFRGILMLHDVQPTGEFDLMPVSLKFLAEKYK